MTATLPTQDSKTMTQYPTAEFQKCRHLMHLPSGKCLGCGERHQPLSDYQPGDDETFIREHLSEAPAMRAKEQSHSPTGDDVERVAQLFKQHHRDSCYPDATDFEAEQFARAALATQPASDTGLREALEKCRDQFREYVKLHRAKLADTNSPRAIDAIMDKVHRNQHMAEMCEAALARTILETTSDEGGSKL